MIWDGNRFEGRTTLEEIEDVRCPGIGCVFRGTILVGGDEGWQCPLCRGRWTVGREYRTSWQIGQDAARLEAFRDSTREKIGVSFRTAAAVILGVSASIGGILGATMVAAPVEAQIGRTVDYPTARRIGDGVLGKHTPGSSTARPTGNGPEQPATAPPTVAAETVARPTPQPPTRPVPPPTTTTTTLLPGLPGGDGTGTVVLPPIIANVGDLGTVRVDPPPIP